MFKVFLVDDEPWTIIDIKKTFNWEKYGFEILGDTQSSRDALEIIERLKPEVVFTDIRMPGLSGIELMKQSRERGIESEFVILSGYGEFSYAKEAIKIGVFEYCLKPMCAKKGNELLERLSKHIDKKKGNKVQEETYSVDTNKLDMDNVEANENFGKILNYIQVNLHHKLYLKDIADKFYINPNYCCHLFNKITLSTYSQYVTNLRMKEAIKLLRNKSLSIEEVGKKIGIDDYFYFNKLFKKQFGVTPSEFRKTQN